MRPAEGTTRSSSGYSEARTSNSTSSSAVSAVEWQKQRDTSIVEACLGLNHVVLVAAWTAIVAIILVFVNEFTSNAIPSWGIFLVLLFGHFVLFLVVLRIMRLVLHSLLPKNDAERATQKWHQANEKRIPLIQYTVYNVGWVFGVSFLLVLVEVLALLYYEGSAPLYACLVPIYLLSGAALLISIVCKSTSLIGAVSWASILAQTLLYNLKVEEAYNGTSLSWTDVLIPADVFVLVWIAVVLYVWVQYLRSVFHLHQYQMESLALYFLAGSAFVLALVALTAYLDNDAEVFGLVPDVKFATGAALVGACAFFAGLSIAVDNVLRSAIERMGGERPRTLVKTVGGSWDVDYQNTHQNFLITGDIESSKFAYLAVNTGERSCGCCSSLELVTRPIFGFGDEEEGGQADESTPLRSGDNRSSS